MPVRTSHPLTCDSIDAFAQVIAKEYVNEALGKQGEGRLRTLTTNLVATYKDLVSDSAWLGNESDRLINEKLDNMTLNVLEPAGGYFDYGKLELLPTEAGGTLFSNYLRLKQYRKCLEA